MKARTKEEKFLLSLYELALESGDHETEIDRYDAGRRVGLQPKGVDTICNELAKANFIKKRGEELVCLTANGNRFIQDMLEE